ncbi:MAG: ANTAR domain-containing response regulator, partial [Actinomycetota bacterium]
EALGEQIEARKIIDRAKGLLMDGHGMKEQDAFGFIQRMAMRDRTKMRDVAERILAGDLKPAP